MKRLIQDRALVILAAIGLACACSSATKHARDSITFSHHLHQEQGFECSDCHGDINHDAERKVEALLTMDGCADCHDIEDEEGCTTCHSNPEEPDTYTPRAGTNLHFSHQKHEDRTSGCEDCHGAVANVGDLSPKNRALPHHNECEMCHQDNIESGQCQMCHDRLDLNPRRPQEIYSHEDGFFDRHGIKAAASGAEHCGVCHDQSFCGDCHNQTMTVRPSIRYPERVDRSFVHRGDWLTRHPIEAGVGDTGCMKCHGTSFCSSCHEQHGVGAASGHKNPHGAGWMTPGTADSHSRAARRRIADCASCHDQGPSSNCVQCHRTGGVNPHPPGWKSPIRGGGKSSHKMCRICHSN